MNLRIIAMKRFYTLHNRSPELEHPIEYIFISHSRFRLFWRSYPLPRIKLTYSKPGRQGWLIYRLDVLIFFKIIIYFLSECLILTFTLKCVLIFLEKMVIIRIYIIFMWKLAEKIWLVNCLRLKNHVMNCPDEIGLQPWLNTDTWLSEQQKTWQLKRIQFDNKENVILTSRDKT